jgi:hypothetical protein
MLGSQSLFFNRHTMIFVFFRSLVCVLALTLAAPVLAMTFHAQPPYLYLGGPLVKSDWDAWEEAMSKYANEIDTVVFHESNGGDSTTGRKIGGDIRKRKLNTVVYGRCVSACANMFLGGISRQFAVHLGAHLGETRTALGFHGSYNKVTKSVNRNRSGDYFVAMTDGKMSEELIERFIRLENKRGFLRFVHPDQRTRQTDPLAMLCKGDEEVSKRETQCERLKDVDALKQGVVTSWATRDVHVAPKPSLEKITVKSWADKKIGTTPTTANDSNGG